MMLGGGPHLAAHGLRVQLPPRWEGRIYLRETPQDDFHSAYAGSVTVPRRGLAHLLQRVPGGIGWHGEQPHPVLHLATFPLPPGRGNYGTGAVELMGREDAFVSLLEFGEDEAGTPLFAHRGMPRPAAAEFSPAALQRRLAGQAGVQRFFTEQGRAFCLYVVLGAHRSARTVLPRVHAVLDRIEVQLR